MVIVSLFINPVRGVVSPHHIKAQHMLKVVAVALLMFLTVIGSAAGASYFTTANGYTSSLHANANSACLDLGAVATANEWTTTIIVGAKAIPTDTTDSVCVGEQSWKTFGAVKFSFDPCPELDPTTGACVETCADGYPPSAGFLLGYSSCDRPTLKQCIDGGFVLSDSICVSVCSDFETCFQYAQSSLPCSTTDVFEFNYIDPLNFSVSCSTLPADSPDLATNGGNQDGDPYNDPGSPLPPTTVTDTHPETLASVIDNVLQNDFSNVERSIRTNTDTLSENLAALKSSNEIGFSDVTNAINNLATSPTSVSLNDFAWSPSASTPGEFPDKAAEIDSLKLDLNSQIDSMKASISSMFTFTAATSPGTLPCWRDLDVLGNPVDICLDDYREQLSPISLLIMFFAGIISISIVLRRV